MGEAARLGHLVLLRHGQTKWSDSGQYTGRTDLPLGREGRQQAVQSGKRLREAFPGGFDASCIFVSPLLRARQTAQLAGFGEFQVLDDLAEWDYGRAEGHTEQEIGAALGRPWNVWRHGAEAVPADMGVDWVERLETGEQIPVRHTSGERLEDVAARTRRAVSKVAPMVLAGSDVLLVAHAHVLRVLATQWLGVDPCAGSLFRIDTAHYAVLGYYKSEPVVERWNA
ncbi:histidine phosphatase family protein [Bifidobacterium bohemicum]|nr:histidine phosphatase family protein [Bifidobacterium bohemicum]